MLTSVVDIKTKLKCVEYLNEGTKEDQQIRFQKSSGTSKEVEVLIGSLTDHGDKYDRTEYVRTLHGIKIGDMVRLKTGIPLTYGDVDGVEREKSIGEVSSIGTFRNDTFLVNFQNYENFHCTLDEIEFA